MYYLLGMTKEGMKRVVMYNSISIANISQVFFSLIYHRMLRFPRPPRRPAMLASVDSELLSRRMTEGRKLALLTALDGGCIL